MNKIYDINVCINYLLTRGGDVNLYKIIFYNNINRNKDYEVTSFNTSDFYSLFLV